jgi:hypothetical protein
LASVMCRPCKDRGRLVAATRVVNGTPFCDPCFRGSAAAPLAPIGRDHPETHIPRTVQRQTDPVRSVPAPIQSFAEEKKPMAKKIDWEEVQRRRDGGTPVGQLMKELGVSGPTIYTHTKGGGKRPAKAVSLPAPKVSPVKAARAKLARNGTGAGSDALVAALRQLHSERDRLVEAIQVLEGLIAAR